MFQMSFDNITLFFKFLHKLSFSVVDIDDVDEAVLRDSDITDSNIALP